ncbi:hypothetical protein pEaSNUABM14_00275 [Erwinia phage pEa_SNUABM_14]|uniref:Uncharacterized protein n=1 Tax=Erwinia phage pEa_SNUABM_7 TaxID=2866695 RepID=A0AAE8BKR4_9CAUD|nr:hypothetical protein MPK74_gp276 [Erwinia phage pEa_SNUABM_7]QYW03234.1 hypothetical protein pEaSNUABM13_00275 [Erwinia phage pEa_SNUABM_13]QYW03575.1 hypothetical protein pEaSNUABM34_00273 [Erwinia phage pEa_SNUABM_34]QYW03916.1 hypothetical protein pEaSNUABM45_00273 [Erwinia phage pEa_SNUABM_45]QYW04257.1 hypothetical protein pEaSNUABM46_00273 [Erwinia phage pEa_SNUABM_46]QYW04600.1 hypothetical protein pEaSNUABM14_00275 [Erwinia phage pEa_SNUABM_14]QYW05287.1 hypothetical protein pEaSNU
MRPILIEETNKLRMAYALTAIFLSWLELSIAVRYLDYTQIFDALIILVSGVNLVIAFISSLDEVDHIFSWED